MTAFMNVCCLLGFCACTAKYFPTFFPKFFGRGSGQILPGELAPGATLVRPRFDLGAFVCFWELVQPGNPPPPPQGRGGQVQCSSIPFSSLWTNDSYATWQNRALNKGRMKEENASKKGNVDNAYNMLASKYKLKAFWILPQFPSRVLGMLTEQMA